ncbi:hypothetical protein H4R20_001414 [Coemansia guatemalensis]|uniref:Thioesterase domain-containing protein n=1 Tax=Coemansia guatemalensis TaxID=2761395 RepID=A0A9W8I5W5_9FUNG|nr:hypothetical protein H4R20_001414 [Coemansia guatemalensis]
MDSVIKGSHYIFTRPMLAAWASCCILFGISIGFVGVSQGWIRLGSDTNPDKAHAGKEHSGSKDEHSASQAVVERIMASKAAQECINNPEDWKRVPYFWPPIGETRKTAFVPDTVLGHEKLSVEPVIFMNRDRKSFVVLVHLGKNLNGHEGIVHGGVQATLFDEITARPAFWNLPRNIGFTATLKVNYRRPVVVDQVLVFRTQLLSLDGRKAQVAAQLEDTRGNLLSDAEALYVSPKEYESLPDHSAEIAKAENTYPGSF